MKGNILDEEIKYLLFRDQLDEDILKELEEIEKIEYDAIEDPLPDTMRTEMLRSDTCKEKIFSLSWRPSLSGFSMMLVVIMTVLILNPDTVHACLDNVLKIVAEVYPDRTQYYYYYNETEEEKAKIPYFELEYVPEGYSLTQTIADEVAYIVEYKKSENEYLIIDQCRLSGLGKAINTEDAIVNTLEKDGITYNYLYNRGASIIFWEYENWSFEVATSEDLETAFSVVYSLKLNHSGDKK